MISFSVHLNYANLARGRRRLPFYPSRGRCCARRQTKGFVVLPKEQVRVGLIITASADLRYEACCSVPEAQGRVVGGIRESFIFYFCDIEDRPL